MTAEAAEIVALTHRLIEAIGSADWDTYQQLCDPNLTCFEPETLGMCVEGMAFHKFYFNRRPTPGQANVTLCDPKVRVMGETALIAYVRLVQRGGPDGGAETVGYQETRLWQKQAGQWKHVHFHRSPLPRG
jgi:calcium/calmodulin-dependent protein kinase (CaM kinase) II